MEQEIKEKRVKKEKNSLPLYIVVLRGIVNIISCISLFVFIMYMVFTKEVYQLIINMTGSLTSEVVKMSQIPLYFLGITSILIIVYTGLKLIFAKKLNLSIPQILVFLIFIATGVFTAPFEYVYYNKNSEDNPYPESYRFDRLFIFNEVYSNEGDYQGGLGKCKYIYNPFKKEIVFFYKGTKVEKVKFLKSKEVQIGKYIFTIENTYFTES